MLVDRQIVAHVAFPGAGERERAGELAGGEVVLKEAAPALVFGAKAFHFRDHRAAGEEGAAGRIHGERVLPPEPITQEHVEQAKERLSLERATHLDSLAARLHEPRVQRILQPLLGGAVLSGGEYNDDLAYVRDLGLVAPKSPLRVANPIYREVIVRVLSSVVQENVTADPRSFVLPDGRLDFPRLLAEFVEFWKEHGEVLEGGMSYHEVAPQLVLMGYLQRLVNGGGTIDREFPNSTPTRGFNPGRAG